MGIVSRWSTRLAGAVCAVCLVSSASADVLLDTGTPGGAFGYYGFDVFVGQSVAVGFTPTQDYAFDDVSLWLMSNDFNAPGRMLTVSLQTGATAPSGTTLESWNHATTAVGWTPVLETLESVTHPLLSAGQTYWIVAESSEPAFVDPVWVAAGNGPSYTVGFIDFQSSPNWQVGLTSGPPGIVINAAPVPEPATLALLLLGVPLVLGFAKRRPRA
jgi:hypothetical protein